MKYIVLPPCIKNSTILHKVKNYSNLGKAIDAQTKHFN